MRKKKRVLIACALALWVLAIAYFSFQLMVFDTTAGQPAHAPSRWPTQSAIVKAPGRKQLLLFVHPECTCTIASFEQLRRLEVLSGHSIDAHVVLWHRRAGSSQRDWRQETGGADVFEDRDGQEARLFGAKTSGQTLIYDEAGKLVYAGGLTVFRAEVSGDPMLRQILAGIVASGQKEILKKAVFGCPITNDHPFAATTTTLWTRLLQ